MNRNKLFGYFLTAVLGIGRLAQAQNPKPNSKPGEEFTGYKN